MGAKEGIFPNSPVELRFLAHLIHIRCAIGIKS